MEFGMENCVKLVMKSGKQYLTDGVELSNRDKIRTFAENETYKYLGVLVADTLKQENYSRQNCLAETLSKNWILGLYSSLDVQGPFSSGPSINLNKWTKEQEN